jgi:lipopolysaccharide biosynthesis regulator YciM
MIYSCYQKMGRSKEADSALQNILSFNMQTDNTLSSVFPANALVTARAVQKAGHSAEASSWLEEQVKANPDNKILVWANETFHKKQSDSIRINDATVRILQGLVSLN